MDHVCCRHSRDVGVYFVVYGDPYLRVRTNVFLFKLYLLLSMDFSRLILDKKERKLQKGAGFHLDIVLICLINVACGSFGFPWMCAATVRSIAHASALTVMSRTHAPGEKPHLIEVKEQRLSSFLVAVLIGKCCFS